MNLTAYTDYSLRVLIYLKIHGDELSTAAEISRYFQLSQNHMVKVIHNLGKLGLIETVRGKGGGVRLLPQADEANVGDLVKALEPERELVQCVNKEGQHCAVTHACRLTSILDDALDAFYAHLNQFKLGDIIYPDSTLQKTEMPVIEILGRSR